MMKFHLIFQLSAFLLLCLPAAAQSESNVRDFGAAGNGITTDTRAIQAAIDHVARTGGGTVLFPPGKYLSGSIYLKSGVTLDVAKGATLLGSPRRADYAKLDYYALILANGQKNIGIRGKGTIDGQGKLLVKDTRDIKPQRNPPYADESERPMIIHFRHCGKIDVRDITLLESSCWVQLYRDCEELTIENITVRTLAAITNDGIDLDGCRKAVVRGCDIDSEDDAICLKSTGKICEDILVENCRARSTCNALKFGTASVKGFRNITCRNLNIYDTYISAIALEIVDGGLMENIRIENIKITDCANPLFIRLGHRNVNGPVGGFKNVVISDITAEMPNRAPKNMNLFPPDWRHRCRRLVTASITGLPGHPIQDITLRNISMTYDGIGKTPGTDRRTWINPGIPECAEKYPESTMFGTLPAWGIYCRHAESIRFQNVTLRLKKSDDRPAIIFDDAQNISLDGIHAASGNGDPAILIRDVKGLDLHDAPAPRGFPVHFVRSLFP